MKLLILLTIVCAVVVSSLPLTPSCGAPAPAPILPVYKAGSDFLHKDHASSASGVHGNHYHKEAGNTFYDQKENHQKTKQVIENESSSKHKQGGSNYGSASGGAFGAYNAHEQGSMTAGSQYQQVGPM